jgi:TonB-linked SusC/RagA family outer membrane protein
MKKNLILKKWFFVFTFIVFLLPALFAQEKNITGRITAEDYPEGIPGANIFLKGTTQGTITDLRGFYSIKASSGDVLVFSYVGYQESEVLVGDQEIIDVYLKPDLVGLDEVVVIGYGTIKKSDLTGSVASVTAEDLNSTPTTNVGEMLRGKVAGLEVNLGTARPGGSSSILIRGRNSLSGGNSPLFIVDGAPVEDINDLNSADISSIEVLKDASAQAVYGARASNGVILITTRRGQEGKITVNYSGYAGIQQVVKNFDLYNGPEWAEMRRQAVRSDISPALDNNPDWRDLLPDNLIFDSKMLQALENEEYVDWEDMVIRDAWMQKHDLSFSGGTEKSRFASSFGYFDQDGVIPTSDYKRGTFRFNYDQKINDWLSFGTNTFVGQSKQNIETEDRNFIIQPPLALPYDEDGNLQMDITNDIKHYNPLLNLYESMDQVNRLSLNFTFFSDIQVTKNLKYRFNSNINKIKEDEYEYLSTKHFIGRRYAEAPGKGGEATIGGYERMEYLIENILDYKKEFNADHAVYATLMQGINSISSNRSSVSAQNFTDDILGYKGISNATTTFPVSYSSWSRAMVSYMARMQYGYQSKYMITLTGRMDGSSVFGKNNKYAFFPSVALAWRVDQENFLAGLDFISNLKLRASIGTIGNEAITPYTTLGLTENRSYTFGDGGVSVGYLPGLNDFPNHDLKWESSKTSNLGLDLSVYKGRINATLDLYKVNTFNLLVTRQVPKATGYNRIWDNLGETENRGFEAVISTHVVSKKDFNWTLDFTYSQNRNKIISISGLLDDEGNQVDDLANNWFIGKPINVYYDYKFDGIWQLDDDIANSHMPKSKPGTVKLLDVDGDTLLTPEGDRVIIEKDPKWIGSLSSSVSYKGLRLSAELYFVQGVTRLNPYLYNYNYGGLVAVFNGVKLDYWTPENPSNSYPRVYLDNATTSQYKSAFAYQDASFIRLRTLTLSYNIPNKWLANFKVSKLMVYATANNLITITDFQSYSPEVTPAGYPDNRSFIAGVNLSF